MNTILIKSPKLPNCLVNRDNYSHKGTYGHGLLIAGSYGKMGCCILASKACMRSGIGLLTVHVPEQGVSILQTSVPEAMTEIDKDVRVFATIPQNIGRYNAIAIGPGIGTEECTKEALNGVLNDYKGQLILDADALNLLAPINSKNQIPQGTIITPHAKEYERLFGDQDAREMAQRYGVYIVYKGYHSKVYCPDGKVYENCSGNPGMATAGSGDVLTGIMLGLASQGLSAEEVATLGVWIHGKSGDIAAERGGFASLIASDIVENLKYAIR